MGLNALGKKREKMNEPCFTHFKDADSESGV